MGDRVGRVFLCYRREDTRHMAGRLADRLQAQLSSAQVFMDVDAIEPGADFTKAIAEAVGSCDILIALIGPHWLVVDDQLGHPRLHEDDDFVALEIRAALERGVHVIPVLVDEARMPGSRDLPDGLRSLATRNAARLDHETFSSDIGRLLAAVDRILRTAQAERTAQHNIYASTQRPAGPAPGPEDHRTEPLAERMAAGRATPFPGWRPPPGRPHVNGASPNARSQSKSGVPVVRIVLRIVLWWATYFLSILVGIGVLGTIVTPTPYDLTTGVSASIMLCVVLTGVVFVLLREISKQRAMVSASGREWQVPGSALSTRHVRIVAIICAVLSVSMGLAMGAAPPAPQPGGSAPASLSTSVLHSTPE
jgi:hypothetical protein